MRRKNQGFTLVELIVTIAIIAIFSGVVLTVVGTGANTFRSTSSNAKVQMKAQDIMDQIQDMIIDVNRSVYYAYGNGIEADTGALVSNDIDTGAVAQNKTFYACTATEIEPDNDPAQEGKPYHYVCDLIEWDSVEQKLYYAQSTWDGRETEKKKNAGNSIESSTTGAANGNGSDQTGDSIGNGLNSAAQLVAESKTDDDAPIVLDDPDMELASAQSDNSNGDNLVLTPTSEIQISDKTLLAENVTDFRVDVSKVVSERVVRFQFTVKLRGKETTSVHTVNLRNQIQVSKPFEGYSSNTSGEAIITIIRYPETVEAGKTATGFSLYKDGAIDPTTITWVVESNNAQIVGGGADDASVTLTANEGLPNDTIITVHVEATTSDGKLIQSKSVQIKVKNTKVPQSLVCNNTDGILLGVGGTDYDLKSLGWKIQYSDGSSESLTEEQLKSISWATDSAITGVSVAASGESGGNITVTKANDGPGTTEENSKFNVTASYTTESGNTVSGTIPVTLARLDILGTTTEFYVGDSKNLTYSYKVGGVEQNSDNNKISNSNGHVGYIQFVYVFNNDNNQMLNSTSGNFQKIMSADDKFTNDDVGSWTVIATLDMSTVNGMNGTISADCRFSVEQSAEPATLKLHYNSGLDTIVANESYLCSSKFNQDQFYVDSNWSGSENTIEIQWKISNSHSNKTGFENSYQKSFTLFSKNNVTLHVGEDETGFILEADLKVKDSNNQNNILHHYRASMSVKIATGIRIIDTFEPVPQTASYFKVFRGKTYPFTAEVSISDYAGNITWSKMDSSYVDWQFPNYYISPGPNNTCEIGNSWNDFNLTVRLQGNDTCGIWGTRQNIPQIGTKAFKVEDEFQKKEMVKKYHLVAGQTQKLFKDFSDVPTNYDSINICEKTLSGDVQQCTNNQSSILDLSGNACNNFSITMKSVSANIMNYEYALISVETEKIIYKLYIYPVEYNVYNCKLGETTSPFVYVPTDENSIRDSSKLIQTDEENGHGYTFLYEFKKSGENKKYKAQIRLSTDPFTGIGANLDDISSSENKWIMRMCKEGTSDWIYYRLENGKWYKFQNAINQDKTKMMDSYWNVNHTIEINDIEVSNSTFWKKWKEGQ